jgi:hypothetical protein
MDRLPIANNAYGDIRIFFANRTKDAPSLQFRGNFPMWQNIEWLKSAKFTEPAEATRSIERVARRAAEAKSTGILADEETIFADRSGNWSRRVEPVDASPAGPALPPPS